MTALLIDLDGVIYQGDQAIAGAADTIAWIQHQQIPHLFVTNTTSRPRQSLVDKLQRLGINTAVEHILTPAVAAVQWLQSHAPGPVALLLPKATQVDFSALQQVQPDATRGAAAVVVGDLGENWNFATLNRAFRLLIEQPPPRLIALGMSRYWRAADGLRLDVAPFVRALECAAGCQAVVLGKPADAFFQSACQILESPAGATVMIGDDIRGDVAGAQGAGLRGLLVRTGKFRAEDLDGKILPDAVLNSIADLPDYWPQLKGKRVSE